MEGFGGMFNDPDLQRRLAEMAEQMQSAQSLAWADNAIKLAVDMTMAAINRVNVQGTPEQQAQQIRSVMATVFPEAVTLVGVAKGAERKAGLEELVLEADGQALSLPPQHPYPCLWQRWSPVASPRTHGRRARRC